MSLRRLTIENLRILERVSIEPGPGLNCLYGDNGAGKTSVLEAIFLLARVRSFRAGHRGSMVREGSPGLLVVGELAGGSRLGVSRAGREWRGRIDGRDCQKISEFARRLPVVLADPSSHALVDGPPEARRSFLDWGLFHVEPDYLQEWRRYARLLRQRNAALKSRAPARLFDALEAPMAQAAARIDAARARYVDHLARVLPGLWVGMSLRFAAPLLAYRPGHEPGRSLLESWQSSRIADQDQGFTRHGPHRAELRLSLEGRAAAPRLSRGQQKLVGLAMRLAALEVLSAARISPVLLLDDPVSELDARHMDALIAWLAGCGAQAWLTTLDKPAFAKGRAFHVEQGRVHRVV